MGAFKRGLSHGLPIGLGYFSVAVGFGILSVTGGLSILQTTLISMTNLTSAGQLAGVRVMFSGGSLWEMAVTQLVINLRYALMSIALSQKLLDSIGLPRRLLIAFFNTDEIFAVSSSQPGRLESGYLWGLFVLPFFGWSLGTLAGAVAGAVLPEIIRNGMGLLIYGMFLAILVPPARASVPIRLAVLIAAGLSCLLRIVPLFEGLSGGFAVVLCALAAAIYCAARFPVKEAA